MKNNNYNLILLHHEEVFETRELALEYLNDFYKPNSLEGEPVLVKYGNSRNPSVILAFGTSDASPGSFYAIDMTKANEKIEELSNIINGEQEDFDYIREVLGGIVKASGLILDDNKITDKVTYEPDPRDNVIGNAVSIAEAIDLLSKYAQENFTDTELSVEDTNSVRLIYEVNPNGGKKLKAEIQVSDGGVSDELEFNNNIIGIKNDGIYAASNLSYDDLRHELIYTTSGYRNGRFQDDAKVQRISLGQHTRLVADNEGNSVRLVIDNDTANYTATISANLQIANREDNILQLSDGKAFVEGKARNISYGNGTVEDALSDLTTDMGKKIEKVEIVKNSQSDLQYILKVDNVDAGEINIPKDRFLSSVTYDPSTKELTFIFETTTGTSVNVIKVDDLIDIYTAGNGLEVENNEFSVRLNEECEAYLTVSEEGLKLFGITDALAQKANVSDVYTKAECDAKYLTEHQSLADYATVSSVETIAQNVSQNTQSLETLNGNESTQGSVKNAIKKSKDYTDEKVAVKANSADVYTKTEIDNKGYLTEHQDISNLATKASLAETEAKATQNASDIAELTSTVDDMKFVTNESDTVVMTMEKETGAETRTLTSFVKIDQSNATNIIKRNVNGIYANVSLSYNKAENKITFNDGNGDKEFILNNFGILEDAFYDSETQSIVLVVKKDDESTKRVTIPVSSLVNTWTVQESATSPVVLTKTTTTNGDVLSADLRVVNSPKNLLSIDQGYLFADGDSNAHYALWGMTETNVQAVLNLIKPEIDKIPTIERNLGIVQTQAANAEQDALDAKTLVNQMADRLSQIEDILASLIDFGTYSD